MFHYFPVSFKEDMTPIVINDDGRRYYSFGENRTYPSITTILGSFISQELIEWENNIGSERADKIRNMATTKGTKLHNLVERYLRNEAAALKQEMPDIRQLFLSIKEHLNKIDAIRCIEQPLFSDRLKIAGTTDCIALYEKKLSVIDFKTSSRIKDIEEIVNYFEQLSGYGQMFYERTDINIDQGIIILATPQGSKVFKINLIDYSENLNKKIKSFYLTNQ